MSSVWRVSFNLHSMQSSCIGNAFKKIRREETRALWLGSFGIRDDDIPEICNLIRASRGKVMMIHLEGNIITSKGAEILFKYLGEDQSVTYINLSANELDDSCMDAAAEMLKNNSYIEYLILGDSPGNQISDVGLEIISQSIICHPSLMFISLGYNRGITSASIPTIKEMILSSTIQNIPNGPSFLGYTSIPPYQLHEIHSLLDTPFDKRTLPVFSKAKSAAKSQCI